MVVERDFSAVDFGKMGQRLNVWTQMLALTHLDYTLEEYAGIMQKTGERLSEVGFSKLNKLFLDPEDNISEERKKAVTDFYHGTPYEAFSNAVIVCADISRQVPYQSLTLGGERMPALIKLTDALTDLKQGDLAYGVMANIMEKANFGYFSNAEEMESDNNAAYHYVIKKVGPVFGFKQNKNNLVQIPDMTVVLGGDTSTLVNHMDEVMDNEGSSAFFRNYLGLIAMPTQEHTDWTSLGKKHIQPFFVKHYQK